MMLRLRATLCFCCWKDFGPVLAWWLVKQPCTRFDLWNTRKGGSCWMWWRTNWLFFLLGSVHFPSVQDLRLCFCNDELNLKRCERPVAKCATVVPLSAFIPRRYLRTGRLEQEFSAIANLRLCQHTRNFRCVLKAQAIWLKGKTQ